MKVKVLFLIIGLMFLGAHANAADVLIDSEGTVTTGTSNKDANLEVIGSSGEDAIIGSANGTGAAGVYGENKTGVNTNYGIQ